VSDNDRILEAELSQEKYQALAIKQDDEVLITPKRVRIFAEPS
jgi:hypothetical protein